MATLNDIQTARRLTPLGSDGLDFEIHREWRERKLVQVINDRELLVYTYSFISPNPRPREVFACDHDSRIADHSIDLDLIDPRWWEFIHFNEERRCLQANPGYTFRELQNAKYHIKPKTKKTS